MTYLRDRFGRIREESVDGRILARKYDELSRVVSRTTPSGATAQWTYDAAGRRTDLTTSGRRLAFTRDPLGRETGRRIGNALVLDLARDDLGRLVEQRVTSASGRLLQRRGYAYRTDGYLLGTDDELAGARSYELDPVGRVTAVSAEGWAERHVYDAAGNQTEADWPTARPGGADATGPRTYEGTRLTSAGRVRYEYDAMGRITLRQCTRLSRKPDTWRYTWDADDRLRAVTTPDGTVWCYTYDPTGRRSTKRRMAADGVTVAEEVTFVWGGTTLCEQTTTGPQQSHAVTLTWDHDGLQPLAQSDLRRPRERRTEPRRLTPARVRRGFRNVRATTARPAAAPKPSRPGPGRPSGSKNNHQARHHHVGKTVKPAESIKEHQARRG
ncbi:hypothetical protein [Streptomyces sp. NPDC057686]|uniref:hypothetical protein n=1 Tax=Streptomyces sp. NPDC057686 TaxID=3346212 RepID=UPI0036A17AEA